jgi:hypothetical protein
MRTRTNKEEFLRMAKSHLENPILQFSKAESRTDKGGFCAF